MTDPHPVPLQAPPVWGGPVQTPIDCPYMVVCWCLCATHQCSTCLCCYVCACLMKKEKKKLNTRSWDLSCIVCCWLSVNHWAALLCETAVCECACVRARVYMVLPSRQMTAHVGETQEKTETWAAASRNHEEKAVKQQQRKWKSEENKRQRRDKEERAFHFRPCLEVFWRKSVCVCGVCVWGLVSGVVCILTSASFCFCRVPDWGSCFSVCVGDRELTHTLSLPVFFGCSSYPPFFSHIHTLFQTLPLPVKQLLLAIWWRKLGFFL